MEENKENSYSHILKYTSIFGGVQGLSILVGVLRNKLVAVILGPEGMGLISLFNSTIKLLSDSTNLGISMTAVREISEAYERGDEKRLAHFILMVRVWSLITAVMGALLCILLSRQLNDWTFTWGDHVLHFVLLSPVVALSALTGGELAILKGTRRLKMLVCQSVYVMLGSLALSIPLYLLWKEAAIVPSILLVAVVQLFFAIIYSYRLYPLRLRFSKEVIASGWGMVRLGVAFVLAGILGSGAEFVIRSYLNHEADLSAVGLYNAGYLITFTYAGMVFQAMETDYYPRLSAACAEDGSLDEANRLVNKQIEVSLLLISPLLITFMVGLPVFLPLLLSSKFVPIIDMMRVASLAMFMRAVTLPIEYISLAKGASGSYLFLELVYDVMIVVLIILGYHFWELTGTGVALLLAGVFNLLLVLLYVRWRFGYRLSRSVVRIFGIHFPLGVAVYLITLWSNGPVAWVASGVLLLASWCYSIRVLRSKSQLWEKLVGKVKARINRRSNP